MWRHPNRPVYVKNALGIAEIVHDLGAGIRFGFWETGDMLVDREMPKQRMMHARSYDDPRLQGTHRPEDRNHAVDEMHNQSQSESAAFKTGYVVGEVGGYIAYTFG